MKGKTNHKNSGKLPLVLSLSLVGLLLGCYFFLQPFHDFVHEAIDVLTSEDEARVKEWVSQFGMWGPLVIIFTMVIQMFMFIVPNILLIIISILSYGPIWGSLIAWIGIFFASSLGYFIGSKLGPITIRRFVGAKVQRVMTEFIQDYGMKAIIVIRLSTFSNDGLSIVAGLLKMNYKRFILATLIGITPLIAIIAFFREKGELEKGLLWSGIILIACLILYIIVDKRRKGKVKA